ncbi:MAG: hypothetical protein ABF682_10080 [Liquorilactobacillus sp.]|uniref:hypothetical protein n=1 Tax=Liquorilactobacillus sp. TaxID=2767923 RepID=UPI0039EB932E
MPHQFLNLGWDEWGSIIVIFGTIFGAISYLGRNLLKTYVKNPLDGVRKDLQQSQETQIKNTAVFEKRAAEHDKMLQGHEILLREHNIRLKELEEEKNERK